jgi:hypothetical protein
MVINAHSLAKPDAAVTLNAELSANNIDICFVTEAPFTLRSIFGTARIKLAPGPYQFFGSCMDYLFR